MKEADVYVTSSKSVNAVVEDNDTRLFDKVAPPAEYADPDVLDISFVVA